MSKNSIIKGTLILTLAGLLTRIIGFFYKIYLSNTLGAEKLGLYQLVFPIYGICFTLYAGGLQTAISKLVAAEHGTQLTMLSRNVSGNMRKILKTGIVCSILIAICLSFLVYFNADFLAGSVLMEPECAASLRVLAFVFPFCGVTACINGYYYGLKKAGVPAVTQLLEQVVRVVSVYAIAVFAGRGNSQVTCELAIVGLLLGEVASNLFNIISLALSRIPKGNASNIRVLNPLVKLSLPLMGNRLLINILHSIEAILIPSMLRKSGLTAAEALAIYGILTGMSIPFILFPSTITNSLATFLLPAVSEANAGNNRVMINHTTSMSVKYSLIVGIFSTGIFMLYGEVLGSVFFHNSMAGNFLVVLSWLCPFMYLSTTLGSIINGLGKTHLTFFNSVIGLSIRILFVLYMVPNKGIYGYLIGLLISELTICLLDCLVIHHSVSFPFDAKNWLLKPIIILAVTGFLIRKCYDFAVSSTGLNPLLLLLVSCFLLLAVYLAALFMSGTIRRKEFRS